VTRAATKARERFFVEQAAQSIGKSWRIEPGEGPDFIVWEGPQTFGLEVSETFTGRHVRAGSVMKRQESETQRVINRLRRQYEEVTDLALRVQFVGNLCADTLKSVVPLLVAEDLQSKPVGYHFVIDQDNGLRVRVTRAFRPEWFSANDQLGWVDQRPLSRIAEAVAKKSNELPRYIEKAGPDVRLLLVANRYKNSGKMMLKEEDAQLDRCGFKGLFLFLPRRRHCF